MCLDAEYLSATHQSREWNAGIQLLPPQLLLLLLLLLGWLNNSRDSIYLTLGTKALYILYCSTCAGTLSFGYLLFPGDFLRLGCSWMYIARIDTENQKKKFSVGCVSLSDVNDLTSMSFEINALLVFELLF